VVGCIRGHGASSLTLGHFRCKRRTCLPYELLDGAPDTFKETHQQCDNSIPSRRRADPAQVMLIAGGSRPLHVLVHFLFKKGDLLDIVCYRPVWLLDTTYKALSGIPTDRLYKMSEKHGLLYPSQEEFRRLMNTQRQVQGLHWATEERAQRRALLYRSYLDFESALKSPDHERLWMWQVNSPG
jgi:hypothetical protein